MKNVELLAPAGSMESLIAAINNGADAIYLGGSKFSARAYASNFDNETMMKAVDYAHSYGVKVYVTMNTLLKQNELKEALKYVGYLYEIGVDALIIQDAGLINLIKNIYPKFELHASTQMTVHNGEGALYFYEKGLQRIVLSRELSLDEIKYISNDLGIETEIFVHGALCVCYSGQCLMSSMIGGRSGNRGRCAQSCRMQYTLKGEVSGERKGYLLSPKDTCLIEDIDAIIKSGTSSLKVEGRMKKPEYVAGVTQNYRKAIDKVEKQTKFDLSKGKNQLAQLFNRQGFAKAYLYKNTGKDMMSFNYAKNTGVFIGKVQDNGEVILEADVALGDGIRFDDDGFTLSKIMLKGKEVKEANKGDRVKLFPTGGYKKGYRLFKMSDKKLFDELHDYIKPYKRKILLTGEVEFKVNAPIILKTVFNGKEYKVYGEIIEEASNKPLSRERVEEALKKSGEIPYKFDNIIFDVFDEGFIRIASLNNLRRELFENILKGKINIEERHFLTISIGKKTYNALNEVFLTKDSIKRNIISSEIYVNDKFLGKFKGDGVIIATPTGSTAYSLSAGGPIITPELKLFLITPIAPHNLNTRPIILSGDVKIVLTISKPSEVGFINIDGNTHHKIKVEDKVEICYSTETLKIVIPEARNYYDVLREKLKWGENLC